jgi:hypothetical protein
LFFRSQGAPVGGHLQTKPSAAKAFLNWVSCGTANVVP